MTVSLTKFFNDPWARIAAESPVPEWELDQRRGWWMSAPGLKTSPSVLTLAAWYRVQTLAARPLDDQCAWTTEACRRSQAEHGRGDDCQDHPWTSNRTVNEGIRARKSARQG